MNTLAMIHHHNKKVPGGPLSSWMGGFYYLFLLFPEHIDFGRLPNLFPVTLNLSCESITTIKSHIRNMVICLFNQPILQPVVLTLLF